MEDWDDLKDLAKRIGYSTNGWNKKDTGNSTAKSQTETSFLSSLLKDATELTHEIETDRDSFERSLREINSINSDSVIRAILAQETRNSQLKARAAIASKQAKSTPDAIAAAGGGLANDSPALRTEQNLHSFPSLQRFPCGPTWQIQSIEPRSYACNLLKPMWKAGATPY